MTAYTVVTDTIESDTVRAKSVVADTAEAYTVVADTVITSATILILRQKDAYIIHKYMYSYLHIYPPTYVCTY